MAFETGVLFFGEVKDGKLLPVTAELANAGRQLADALGQELAGALIGEGTTALAQEVIALGADKVYVVDDPMFKDYVQGLHVPAAVAAAGRADPSIILSGQTANGRDLAPHLAFHLDTGIAIDCTAFEIDADTKGLRATRPFAGGNFLQVLGFKSRPQIATARAKAYDGAEPDSSRKGEVIPVEHGVDASQARMRYVEYKPVAFEGVRLEDAQVIVSGGRGVGSADGFKELEELAGLLSGAVGATRAATDSGFFRADAMIGITGVIVAPDVYIAIGISGASQHLAGCSGSKTIVAINKDPDAAIFKNSRFGIVGDYHQVLPAFTEEVRKIAAGS